MSRVTQHGCYGRQQGPPAEQQPLPTTAEATTATNSTQRTSEADATVQFVLFCTGVSRYAVAVAMSSPVLSVSCTASLPGSTSVATYVNGALPCDRGRGQHVIPRRDNDGDTRGVDSDLSQPHVQRRTCNDTPAPCRASVAIHVVLSVLAKSTVAIGSRSASTSSAGAISTTPDSVPVKDTCTCSCTGAGWSGGGRGRLWRTPETVAE